MISDDLERVVENQNQLIRAMRTVGGLVLPLEDEERVIDVVVEQLIEAAGIRSLLVAFVYGDQGYLEIVRMALYTGLDAQYHRTPLSSLRMSRVCNRRYPLTHPTAICRAVRGQEPLIIVDGQDPKLADDPEYNPAEWRGKVAYFVRLMYRDECIGVLASACNLEEEAQALDWIDKVTPLLDIASSTIKAMRQLKAQRFLAYQPPVEVHLSDREREVLRRVALGESSADIAEIINLSLRTVHTYRRRICNKLNRHTQADLTRYAIMTGLIPLTD